MVITVAYRLGIFGFFTTMDYVSPGNYGLMDQSAALHWIKQNIKLFGGNEKSVRRNLIRIPFSIAIYISIFDTIFSK